VGFPRTAIPGPAHALDDAAWFASIHANLTSAFMLCRAALPSLVERRGSIVIVSSLAAVAAGPNLVGYTTTKHGLTGLMRSLARDYSPQGVRVTRSALAARSPMADQAMDSSAPCAASVVNYRLLCNVPWPAGRADEVAAICAFLCLT
jgi:NAD(P)-dependent dehydrogenase (short-subunit alcohol dehydrogenase family)